MMLFLYNYPIQLHIRNRNRLITVYVVLNYKRTILTAKQSIFNHDFLDEEQLKKRLYLDC